jgi:hypothetical protein
MSNIYDDNTFSEEKEEEDDNYQKMSMNDSDSMMNDGNNLINKENSYGNDYFNNGNNNVYFNSFMNKRPRTNIDYLYINSDEYKKYKMYQKINSMLNKLTPLPKMYIDEICNLSWFYSKKLTNKKLSTIVPIIIYKIKTKYNIKAITLKDLKKKLNFSSKKYFKNEKLFTELNTNVNIEKDYLNKMTNNLITSNYSELVYNSVKNYIKKLKEKSQTSLNIIKIKGKKKMSQINKDIFKFNNGHRNEKDDNNKIIEK